MVMNNNFEMHKLNNNNSHCPTNCNLNIVNNKTISLSIATQHIFLFEKSFLKTQV